jgi:hypothetical protein
MVETSISDDGNIGGDFKKVLNPKITKSGI